MFKPNTINTYQNERYSISSIEVSYGKVKKPTTPILFFFKHTEVYKVPGVKLETSQAEHNWVTNLISTLIKTQNIIHTPQKLPHTVFQILSFPPG